jgi:hypothetical protein
MVPTPRHAKRFLQRIGRTPQRLVTLYTHRVALGPLAPRAGEVIDVDPRDIRGHLPKGLAKRLHARSGFESGAVIGGDWDRQVRPVKLTEKEVYTSCHLRWIEGQAWEDTPIFKSYLGHIERGVPCDFKSVAELVESYRRLDEVFAQVRDERRLSERYEHLVLVNMDREGGLSWGPNGRHRVTMALICGFESIPARVGFIHRLAVDRFQALRRGAVASA